MKPISRISLTDECVRSMKEYIASGKVGVGDKMPTEAELCQMLGVSRSTVREAVRAMQALGYVELRPGKGVFVCGTEQGGERMQALRWFAENKAEIGEMLDFRKFLEPYVTRLAAERITDKEVTELTQIMAQFERAYWARDHIAMTLYEKAFHISIMRGCHSAMFLNIYECIIEPLNAYFAQSFALQESAVHSLEPHQRILCAIQARDADLAEREMRHHMELTIAIMQECAQVLRTKHDPQDTLSQDHLA